MNKTYIYCSVLPANYKNPYSYICDFEINEGDIVVIPIKEDNIEKVGLVLSVKEYTKANAPWPVEYTKHILRQYGDNEPDELQKQKVYIDNEKSIRFMNADRLEKLKIKENIFKHILPKQRLEESKSYFSKVISSTQNNYNITLDEDIILELYKYIKLSSDRRTVTDYKNTSTKYRGIAYIPSGVETIEDNAFLHKKINTYYFPKELKNIGIYTFYDKQIKRIYVDKDNKNFMSDDKAFYSYVNGKKKLELVFDSSDEEYIVPEDVSIVGTNAFSNNHSIKRIILSEGNEEFYEDSLNSNIKEITISKTVKKLYPKIYEESYDPKINVYYHIDEENPYLFKDEDSIYEVLEDNTYKLILNTYDGKGEILVLDNTSIIGRGSFSRRNGISKFNSPKELKEIEDYAFSFSEIKSVIISDGCLKIGSNAFSNCYNLKEVTIPSNLSFCKDTFSNCGQLFEINTNDKSKIYEFVYGPNYERNIIVSINGKEEKLFDSINDKEEKTTITNKNDLFSKFATKFVKTVTENSIMSTETKNNRASYDKEKRIVTVKLSFIQKDESLDITKERVELCEHLNENDKVNIEVKDGIIEFKTTDGSSIGVAYGLDGLLTKYNNIINISEGFIESITPKSKRKSNAKYATGLIEFEISEVDNSELLKTELEMVKNFNYTELEDSVILTRYIGDKKVKKVTIPSLFKGKKVTLGPELFDRNKWNDYTVSIEELVFSEGIKELGDSALYYCDSFKKIILPKSIEYISPKIFTSKDGYYKNLYLKRDTVYVVEQGSYAEEFLKNYKLSNCSFNRFKIINEDNEESINAVKELSWYSFSKYTGCLTASFNMGFQLKDFSSKEVTVPTISNNEKIEGFSLKDLPNSLNKIIIPKEIINLYGIKYEYLFYENGLSLESIEIDDENPNYYSDGKAIFTKDRRKLLRFMSYVSDSYTIPEGTEEISEYAFGGMRNLTKLTLPSSLKIVSDNAFNRCSKLEDIMGLEYVQEIGKDVFSDKLDDYIPFYNKTDIIIIGDKIIKYNDLSQNIIRIPDGIKEIAREAFAGINKNDHVQEIILPEGVEIIGESAFCNRRNLKKINVPEGVKVIPRNAFSLCEKLEYLSIPSSVEKIELSALPGYNDNNSYKLRCNSLLKNIEIDPNNKNYCFSNGMLFNKDKTELLAILNYEEKVINIPEGIKSIADNLMYNNSFIEEVILPESLTNIGKSAFYSCDNLKKVILPKNLLTISDSAFFGCKKLKEVIWPDNLKNIEAYAFAATGFTKLELPNTIEHIGMQAFAGIHIKSVTLPKSVRTLEWGVFSGIEEITVYDCLDPDAKDCTEEIDTSNGNANSLVGYIGIGYAFAMWECAANHEWLNYTIIVKSAQTDEIKYKVWMGADSSQRDYYCFLSSGWGHNATFAFSYLDEFFPKIRGEEHKKKVSELRLEYPYELSDEKKKMYENYLKKVS